MRWRKREIPRRSELGSVIGGPFVHSAVTNIGESCNYLHVIIRLLAILIIALREVDADHVGLLTKSCNFIHVSLRLAILGSLSSAPASGYDLARQFGLGLGWFWSASHSQIYPELKRLEEAREACLFDHGRGNRFVDLDRDRRPALSTQP
jgi:hypothetical protein